MSIETVTQQISSAYRQLRQAHADLLAACERYHAEARANYEHRVRQLEVDAPNLRFALADWNASSIDADVSRAVTYLGAILSGLEDYRAAQLLTLPSTAPTWGAEDPPVS